VKIAVNTSNALNRRVGIRKGVRRVNFEDGMKNAMRRANHQRACQCMKAMSGMENDYDPFGSWLSKAFKKVTGTKLSNVIGPIGGIIGTAVGGPLGGVIGGIAGGNQGQTQGPMQPSTFYGPQGNFDVGKLLTDVLTENRRSMNQAAKIAAVQAPPAGIDSKTMMIGGAALLAVVLLTRK